MDRTRQVCSTGSSLRKANNLRVRLPLASLTVATNEELGTDFRSIIADELNVKDVTVMGVDQAAAAGFTLEQKLTVNARAAGPRLGRNVQAAIKGSKTGDWSVAENGTVTSGGIELEEGEYTLEEVADAGATSAALAAMDRGFVALDIEVTDGLRAEGVARDAIRAIQNVRKQLDLDVADRITVLLSAPEQVRAAVDTHRDMVAGEVLAVELDTTSEQLSGDEVFTAGELASDAAVQVKRA